LSEAEVLQCKGGERPEADGSSGADGELTGVLGYPDNLQMYYIADSQAVVLIGVQA